jgi:hypothetical protein
MTDALVEVNNRLAHAARASGFGMAVFHCECGDCLAEDVRLSLDEHEQIRAREDLIFAPGHSCSTTLPRPLVSTVLWASGAPRRPLER